MSVHQVKHAKNACSASRLCMQSEDGIDVEARSIQFQTPNGPVNVTYDLLAGADGTMSKVRLAMVKADSKMASQTSFVGPMRYVSAQQLPSHPDFPTEAGRRLTLPPLPNLFTPPKAETAGTSQASEASREFRHSVLHVKSLLSSAAMMCTQQNLFALCMRLLCCGLDKFSYLHLQ
jgi:2-polyprenyl-6-methoxyphenol hydroxylase-like FAD-dependent oxidoreductase